MLIEIKVIPSSGKSELTKTETGYRARIKSAPVDGKANEELVALLSREFGVPKNRIEIKKGRTGRNKIVSVDV